MIRAIGVSNFYPDRLADMVAFNEIAPMVDQVETNPLNQQIEARKNMVKRGVAQEAWAPFGRACRTCSPIPPWPKIGEVHGKSVAQVILRWLTQRDIVALPKSTHKERMEENLNIFDFRLSDSEMTTIAGLDTKTSMFFRHDTPEAVDRFVGWCQGTCWPRVILAHDMVGAGSTVYLGFPIWWMAPVWLVNDSVKSNDFAGKTIIPFCTSASSDIGNSASTLQKNGRQWYMAYRASFLGIVPRRT